MVHRTLTLFLMVVFVLAMSGTVLGNGKGSVDGQKQIGEAAEECTLTVVTTDETSVQEVQNQIGLTEINRMAFIHSPKNCESDGQIVNVADTASCTEAVAVEKTMKNKIEVGCDTAMYFGKETEVALLLGPACVGQTTNA